MLGIVMLDNALPTEEYATLQMLWRLDHSEAVDISGIRNESLKKLLEVAFDCLKLLKAKQVRLCMSAPFWDL